MTRYNGGKKQIGREIAHVIEQYEKKLGMETSPYFEPFCGMLGVYFHQVSNSPRELDSKLDREYLACDLNPDIIAMWRAVQAGWAPPIACTEEEYGRLKMQTTPSADRGFIGSACSFGGAFFSGYSGKYTKKDYLTPSVRNIEKYRPITAHITFLDSRPYDAFRPKGMVIYCDPPYKNNHVPSKYFQGFDHARFWDVMREWSKDNLVFVSELEAPSDFKEIYSKSHGKKTLGKTCYQSEKLFTLEIEC